VVAEVVARNHVSIGPVVPLDSDVVTVEDVVQDLQASLTVDHYSGVAEATEVAVLDSGVTRAIDS
jgi:hypothetical protein